MARDLQACHSTHQLLQYLLPLYSYVYPISGLIIFDYNTLAAVDLRLLFDTAARDQVYMVLAMAVHRSALSIDQILAFY